MRLTSKVYKEAKALYLDLLENPRVDLAHPARGCSEYVVYRRMAFSTLCGLEVLGQGHFSSALALSDKLVLKITRRQDRGYENFVKFLEGGGKQFSCFPKVFMTDNWGGAKVYVMERLEAFDDNNMSDRELLAQICRNFIYQDHKNTSRFISVPSSFYDGLEALQTYFKQTSLNAFSYDLHEGNVGVRGRTGEPVIIDPFS